MGNTLHILFVKSDENSVVVQLENTLASLKFKKYNNWKNFDYKDLLLIHKQYNNWIAIESFQEMPKEIISMIHENKYSAIMVDVTDSYYNSNFMIYENGILNGGFGAIQKYPTICKDKKNYPENSVIKKLTDFSKKHVIESWNKAKDQESFPIAAVRVLFNLFKLDLIHTNGLINKNILLIYKLEK